jgi:O-methyltransferase
VIFELFRRLRRRPPASGADLYLELLRDCVGNRIHDDDLDLLQGSFVRDASGKLMSSQAVPVDAAQKRLGSIWPSRAHTMIGLPRLNNLRRCVETVLKEHVAGDFLEAGVWRGGAVIFMRGILKAYNIQDRIVWVADSFEGLPPADPAKYPKESPIPLHLYANLAVSLEQVRENFARYGLLDDQVRFLKGWFRDTLPTAPIEKLALMRLDGDLYESTMDGLVALYPKLSPGGFAIIDDYNFMPSCNEAVDDFRRERGIQEPLSLIEGGGAFWRKT